MGGNITEENDYWKDVMHAESGDQSQRLSIYSSNVVKDPRALRNSVEIMSRQNRTLDLQGLTNYQKRTAHAVKRNQKMMSTSLAQDLTSGVSTSRETRNSIMVRSLLSKNAKLNLKEQSAMSHVSPRAP